MENPPPSYIEISEDEVEELHEDLDVAMPTNDDQPHENEDDEVEIEEIEEIEDVEDDVDEDEEEDQEEEEDDDDEEDEEDEEEDEEIDADYATYLAELLASSFARNGGAGVVAVETESRDAAEEGGEKRRRIGEPETATLDGSGSSQGGEWNRSDIDGLFCPICLDAWTNEGDHRICCLPCGHIYGMSCITKWLQRRNSRKCPQCNQKCKLKDVRKLFSSQVVSVNEESQKRIRALEDKCASLEKKVAVCCKKEDEWLKREAELKLQVQQLTNLHEGSSQKSASIRELEEELVAERALRHKITLSRVKAEQSMLSFEHSWLKWWDQVVQQLGFVTPPTPPPFLPSVTQPDQHVGEEDHA